MPGTTAPPRKGLTAIAYARATALANAHASADAYAFVTKGE